MAPDDRPVTVVIADDNDLLVDALRLAVSAAPGLEVVATASDGSGAVEETLARRPDVVLIDLRLGGEWGLDVVPALLEVPQAPEVVVFTAAELQEEVVEEAARVGVTRLLPKGAPLEEVIRTLADAGESRRAGEQAARLDQ